MMLWKSASAVLLALTSALAQPNPGALSGYTAAHDPAMCKVNGRYLVYTTAVGAYRVSYQIISLH
jgi:hypothetical protein